MIKIVSFVLQLAGVCGGVFLGLTLKGGAPAESYAPEDGEEQVAEAKSDGEAKKDEDKKKDKDEKKDKKDKKAKSDKKGKDDKNSNRNVFVRFSRQFIVPVVHTDGANSLVMLDINLEVSPTTSEAAYAQEPKVRDALLATLLELSTEGAFSAAYTEQDNLDAIRIRLLAAARDILGDEVHQVLILSLARQGF